MAAGKHISTKPDWYRAWAGDTSRQPHSQGDAVDDVMFLYSPLQAIVSFITGSTHGDAQAMREYIERFEIDSDTVCDVCEQRLTDLGLGHAPDCLLAACAIEVIRATPSRDEIPSLKKETRRARAAARVDRLRNKGR